MNRRTLLAAVPALAVLPTAKSAEAAEAEELDYLTFYVYPETGRLAYAPDAHRLRHASADVVAYELIGMPETYDPYDARDLPEPVQIGAWLREARFPRDAWGEPTFIRVYYREASS